MLSKAKPVPPFLMVENPYTGQLVNVLPLMQYMNQGIVVPGGGPADVVGVLQQVHDFLSTKVTSDEDSEPGPLFDALRTVNYNVVSLRQVFESMSR